MASSNQLRKEKAKRRKRKRRIRRTILLLLLVIAGGTAFCMFAPIFRLTGIEVEGNSRVDTDTILTTCGIEEEINIFKVNKNKTAENLKKIPYIDTVKLQRVLPNKIKLTVTESQPAFLAECAEQYLLLDGNGKLLEAVSDASIYQLPHLVGLNIKKAEPASKISIDDDEKFDIIINNSRLLAQEGILEEVAQMDASDILNFKITLKTGLLVTFGKSDHMDYKLSMYKKALPEIEQVPGAYLDLASVAVAGKAFSGKNEVTPAPSAEAPADGSAETPADPAGETTEQQE